MCLPKPHRDWYACLTNGVECVLPDPRMKLRLKQEARDLLELVLLPGLTMVLPWAWCFKVFKRAARWSWLYREACEESLRQARQRGWGGKDEAHWLWQRRLTTLVDHADLYLSMTRSNRWMQANMSVQGTWPTPGSAAVLCTFHWGAGMWGLRHASGHGLDAYALVAPLDAKFFVHRWVLYHYAKLRTAEVAKVLGNVALDVSESLRPALKALQNQQVVMAAVDVPADTTESAMPIRILGMPAAVPRALLRLAVKHNVPVYVYVTGLDTRTGQRWLSIKPMSATGSLETMSYQVFAELEQLIAQDSSAWHFWGVSERFFSQ